MARMGLVALAVSLSCLSCAYAEFHPRSVVPRAQVTAQAMRIYEDDVQALRVAGAEVVGTVDASGSGSVVGQGQLAEKAADVAAENGGTHFLLTDRGVSHYFVTSSGSAETACSGGTCSTSFTMPTTRDYPRQTAVYVVFRVNPDAWDKLPYVLRPSPR